MTAKHLTCRAANCAEVAERLREPRPAIGGSSATDIGPTVVAGRLSERAPGGCAYRLSVPASPPPWWVGVVREALGLNRCRDGFPTWTPGFPNGNPGLSDGLLEGSLMHAPTAVLENQEATTTRGLRFMWLEITGKCQLQCGHCYADSGPTGTHGHMSTTDWRRVIEQAANLGVEMVQFIGGEPTLHPDLPELIQHALSLSIRVEVYSNLLHVSDRLWQAFRLPGVSLANSWYSEDPAEHAQIVGGTPTAHRRTLANIALATAYGIPIRAGLISFTDQQQIAGALTQLDRLGIERTGVDHVRGVGRGASGQQPNINALCGQCANGKLAILPNGDAYPCVFSRWPQMLAGNVRQQTLEQIVTGTPLTTTRTQLQTTFDQRDRGPCTPCVPMSDPCSPDQTCNPATDGCSPSCRQDATGQATSHGRGCAPEDCIPGADGRNPGCDPNIDPRGAAAQQRFGTVTRGCPPDVCLPDIGCAPGCDPNFDPRGVASQQRVGDHSTGSARGLAPVTGCSPNTDGCSPESQGCRPDTEPCGPEMECKPSGN